MDHWKRIECALVGEPSPEPLVALWRHFPEDDQSPDRLVAKTLEWQNRWDFDVVKFMPSGTYGVEDWGAVSAFRNAANGAREVVQGGIRTVADWENLALLDTRAGSYGRQNEALAAVARELRGRVPILQTIFSPLTTARKLAGDRVFADMRNAPDALERGLRTITEVTIQFALEAIECGAHGMFFATQVASHRLLTNEEHERFGRAFDLQVLNAIRKKCQLNMLHVHGVDTMFAAVASYPVEMMNWHDRLTAPSLQEARQMFSGVLAGGLNEGDTVASGDIDRIEDEVQDALARVPGGKLMIAPGCVVHTSTTEESIEAVVRAARSVLAI